MEILCERLEDVHNEILVEEVEGKKVKNYFLEGICIQSEVPNRNLRVYPKAVVKPVIDKYITEMLDRHMAVGHLNHPNPDQDPRNNPKEISHKFEKLTEVGDNWVGRARVTTGTPNGSIVAGLMESGIGMGISTRGVGKTKEFTNKGQKLKVVQNFHLISPGDIVMDPSAPDAYLTALMENKEWVWENGLLVEHEKEIKTEVNTLAKNGKLNESMIQLFQHLIKLNSGAK